MKNDEVIKLVLELFIEHTKLTAKEIHELIPEDIAMIQIHKAIKTLKESKMLKEQLSFDLKYFSLIGSVPEKQTSVKVDKGGRDVSKYKFNGQEYGKSRLAHAIITSYVKKNKPTYKQLCEVFPVKLIPPYGLIKPKAEALEVSKDRDRFFLKDHEVIELPDGPVCVSNQFTKERIEKLIRIAQEELGYNIN
ncbi:MAG: hypothetical protein COA31_007570 [Flavobacteriales bacterium]|nr:hypothetical protein [Flavobacteriales bacterium]